MKNIGVLILIGALILLVTIFGFKYYQVKKQNGRMESLLYRAAYSIERDNNDLYSSLESIVEGTYIAHRKPHLKPQRDRLYAFYHSTPYIDSLMLSDSLLQIVEERIALNDSLLSFYEGWFIHGLKYDMFYLNKYFEHEPTYSYGDTVNYVVNLRNPPYFLDNTFEIVDFTQKQYGSVQFKVLKYLIPTGDFVNPNETPKEVEFEYQLVIRNTYSKALDTTYEFTKFIVH